MIPIYLDRHELGGGAVAALRAYWEADEDYPGDEAAFVRPRDLRFLRASGQLDGERWHGQLVELLTGALPSDVAPCARHLPRPGAVTSVRPGRVSWGELTGTDWRALRAHGLPAEIALSLQSGEPSTDPREPQRAAARALLAHVASGPWPSRVEAAADLVREAILSDALAAAEGSRTVTAEALGVTDERVAEALRRYPHLAAEWPGRRGRPAKR